MFFGCLLEDGYAEKHGNGVRLTFHHSTKQVEYLKYVIEFLSSRNYCSPTMPAIISQYNKNGETYYSMIRHTYTFSSLVFIRELFYPQGIKVIPQGFEIYLTPLAIAFWLIDDKSYTGSGVLLHTHSFTQQDVQRIANYLTSHYGWSTVVRSVKH
jgi:hypothetical protein